MFCPANEDVGGKVSFSMPPLALTGHITHLCLHLPLYFSPSSCMSLLMTFINGIRQHSSNLDCQMPRSLT